jgi:hypothetical protein
MLTRKKQRIVGQIYKIIIHTKFMFEERKVHQKETHTNEWVFIY